MGHAFDLEERTSKFAHAVRDFVQVLPRNITNTEYIKQLVRSSGSIGANYIEANESLGKKDFLMKIKICRKEAKESSYWLGLILIGADKPLLQRRDELVQESVELIRIFTTIHRNKN